MYITSKKSTFMYSVEQENTGIENQFDRPTLPCIFHNYIH